MSPPANWQAGVNYTVIPVTVAADQSLVIAATFLAGGFPWGALNAIQVVPPGAAGGVSNYTVDLNGATYDLAGLRFSNNSDATGENYTLTNGTLNVGSLQQTGSGDNTIAGQINGTVAGAAHHVSQGTLRLLNERNTFDGTSTIFVDNAGLVAATQRTAGAPITQEMYAYNVAAGTAGGQNYGGSLGMDFDVASDIQVTSLGVFDSLANGINGTVSVQLFDRATQLPVGPQLDFNGGRRSAGQRSPLPRTGHTHPALRGIPGFDRGLGLQRQRIERQHAPTSPRCMTAPG